MQFGVSKPLLKMSLLSFGEGKRYGPLIGANGCGKSNLYEKFLGGD